ncbi:MAG: hypothetical protein MSC31_15205 [Solirubrobacteraceae bacterium MAG38_C4-C5]|nr:hypothetical protein [Candidatus Siliceabacter maunaloa]
MSTLTAVQRSVLDACIEHADVSFLNVTPEIWWRAGPPFRGGRATFAAHLRALEQFGMLERSRARAGYRVTPRGRRTAGDRAGLDRLSA